VYERRIDFVTREWTDSGGAEAAPHVAVVGYVGLLFAWLLSRVFVFLGVLAVVASLFFAFGLAAQRPTPKRVLRTRPANVKLTEAGIEIEDEGMIPAELIASAYVQPNGADRPLLVVRGHDGKAIFQAFADDETDAARMLDALGHDPQHHRTLFVATSPLAKLGLVPIAIATMLTVLVVSLPFDAKPFVRLMAGSVAFVAGLAYSIGPQRIEIGTEGMLVTWRGRRRYIRFDDITSIERKGTDVRLKHADRVLKLDFAEGYIAEAFEYRLRIGMSSASGAPSPTTARLSRGAQSLEEWRASLRRLGDVSYRDAGVSEDELWQIVHDPAANEDARAAAALLLRARPEAHPRLRVAAESAASPRLRIALEAAADPEVEEEKILDRFAS
jgi:hypothetical protein